MVYTSPGLGNVDNHLFGIFRRVYYDWASFRSSNHRNMPLQLVCHMTVSWFFHLTKTYYSLFVVQVQF